MKSKQLKCLNSILDRYIKHLDKYSILDLTYDIKAVNIKEGYMILDFIEKEGK